MEVAISKKKKRPSFFKAGKIKLIIILLLGLSLIGAIAIGSMLYGVKMYRSGQVGSINYKLHDFYASQFSFIPNYVKGLLSSQDEFRIDIKFKDMEALRSYRNLAITNTDFINPEAKQYEISARLTHQGNTHKIKMGLTGFTIRHVAHPEKWSFRIKVRDGASVMGLKEFNLLYPGSRGYLSDWIGHQLQKELDLIALRLHFVKVIINGNDLGLYCLEESYDNILLESNQRREGLVFKWGELPDVYNQKKITPEMAQKIEVLNNLVRGFNLGDIGIDQLFDVAKMAKSFALNDLMNGGTHGVKLTNTRFYFNPITNLIEPIDREWDITANKYKSREKALSIELLRNESFFEKFFKNSNFLNLYYQELKLISDKTFLDDFFEKIDEEMRKTYNAIYRDNPFYIFPKEVLYQNQEYIKANLSIDHMVAAYLKSSNDSSTQVLIRNLHWMPVQIKHMGIFDSRYYPQTNITEIPGTGVGTGNQILTVDHDKTPLTELRFSIPGKIISKLKDGQMKIYYEMLGDDSTLSVNVFPWSNKNEGLTHNFTRQLPNLRNFQFAHLDPNSKRIEFDTGRIEISSDLIIPGQFEVIINEHTKLDLTNSASIISYSPILLAGSAKNPIVIESSDSTGQGLIVLNSGGRSRLHNVQFKNLCNVSKRGYNLTGAVVFYNSDVSIDNCLFENNLKGDDFLNIIRSDFEMKNTEFKNVLADAFDSDFCTGQITNSQFTNCGNDAIDVSGTNLSVEGVHISQVGDKGLSAGENSRIEAFDLTINSTEISVSSKDLSVILLDNIYLQNNEIGLNAFRKKTEFGPGFITASNVQMKDVTVPYLVEKDSRCIVDGKEISMNTESVKDLLYGIKYGKSSE